MTRWGRVLVLVALFGTGAPAGLPYAAAEPTPVTVQIDAAELLPAISPSVPGVVVQVSSPSTPSDRATEIGLESGRYSAYWHAHMAGNMPVCWDPDDEDRFDGLDAAIGKGVADGLDMSLTHLQLAHVSPCDIAPEATPVLMEPIGNQGFRPANPQYPAVSMATILTHPELVQAMLEDQIRHVVDEFNITHFTVWNEPDLLYPVAPSMYLDYWDLAYAALESVETERGIDLQIGGPVAAHAGSSYIKMLLDHVVRCS